MRETAPLPLQLPAPLGDAGSPASEPVRFTLSGVPERERAGVFREFFGRSLFRLDVEPLRDRVLEVDVTLQRLPGLQLFTGRRHGSHNRRTKEMLADGCDDFSLMINLGGAYEVSQGRHQLVLGDGEATFLTSAEPTSFTHHPPGEVLALRFPRAPFAPLVTNLEDCYLRRIPAATPALHLLRDYVGVARQRRTMKSRELQHLAVSHIYDLMAVALGATRDAAATAEGRGLRAARLHAIKQDIAGHLDDPELSVASIATRHRCTPRFVQRLFEAEGTTFTDYVLAQRLMRAHRMLSDPRRDRDKISAVAYDCGFGDVSYFNRAFRRQFCVAPSEVRDRAAFSAPDFPHCEYDQLWSI